MQRSGKLSFSFLKVSHLREEEINVMWELYARYYDSVTKEKFKNDLFQKQIVIMLYEKKSKILKGFSTQMLNEFEIGGKKCRILFSGDTIIEKEYWGQKTLQFAFTLMMMKIKLQRPLCPLYWILITKGFKTYLLLSNNFKYFWPRFSKKNPHYIQTIMDEYAGRFFQKSYNKEKGLLIFESGEHEHLKSGVADILEKDLLNPNIRFFTEKNPNWKRGDELVCVGEFDLCFFVRLLFKNIKRKIIFFKLK